MRRVNGWCFGLVLLSFGAVAAEPVEVVARGSGAGEPEVGRSHLGGAGLARVRSAFMAPRALSVSATAGFFRAPGVSAGGLDEYRTTLVGTSFTPLSWLEVSMTLRSTILDQPASALRTYYLVNDAFLRFKASYTLLDGALAAGGELYLRLPPPVFRANPITLGLSPGLGGVVSYDASKKSPVPVVLHLNTSFFFDNSADFDDGTTGQTRRLALDITTFNQWRTGLGVEARWRLGAIGVRPFVEYTADVALGAPGPVPMRVIPGVRVLPWRGLFVDGLVEIGVSRPTARGVAPVSPWQVMLSLGYQTGVDDAPARLEVVERVVEKERLVQAKSTRGTVKGIVIDAATKQPIADAIISMKGRSRLLSEADGTFQLLDVEPGPLVLTVTRQGYATREVAGTLAAAGTVELNPALSQLPPEPPAPMTIRGTVFSEDDKPVVATIAAPNASLSKKTGATGDYEFTLASGEQSLEVAATGFMTQGKRVVGRPGEALVIDFVLKPVPKQALVVLRKEKIEIKKQVHFATASDVILPDSSPLLDQIASLILENDRLKRIRVEGHTDDQGDDAYNLNLSDRRAKSVMRALLERGVQSERIGAVGFGETKPIGDNKKPAGRAQNRRVEFMIEAQE
ncbi:MAG: OmpA family protein [Myxococcales bacterium]|nr:OmpA family protein [Myxococcales bacterium]